MVDQPRLDFDTVDPLEARDAAARALSIDPTRNVALEASAGTGKTRVLVDRYVALLMSGIKPRNILAITFTRKAAAEMRQRILDELARRHREGTLAPELWREIRESLTDISISTIDAFCLALLREFPLEADVDPGFELADETETPRLVDEALERTLRIGRGLAGEAPEMALLFAELGEMRLRQGLARLIDRRLVAVDALNRFVRGAADLSIDEAVRRLLARLRAAFASVRGGLDGLLESGPVDADFTLVAGDLRRLLGDPPPSPPLTQALLERVRAHLLTQRGEPRKRVDYRIDAFRSRAEYDRHNAAVIALGPYAAEALAAYRREINVVLARAVRQLFAIALDQYRRTLDKHGVLDFPEVLERTLTLLSQMEEFSRSRYKLESRYQHVLVDEFQDTSRAQWALVEWLVRSWAEGAGLVESERPPTVFIVGDRKQSIYAFRDAEVAVLDEAARYIQALRPTGQVRTAITRSFRSVRELLQLVNDLFAAIEKAPERADAFRYTEDDVFPVASVEWRDADAIGIVGAASDEGQAEAVAEEIARLLIDGTPVRDRDTGVRRPIRPGDIAILFRTRESHKAFEVALARRRVPYYVYKGLGFFDADEIKDVLALLGFLANPASQLAAAAVLRSRFIRLSDAALKQLAPALSAALIDPLPPAACARLEVDDLRRLELARAAMPAWLDLVDKLPPAELLDRVIAESAYAAEIAGPSYRQARENLKKVRALVRRIQNRGYATLARIVDHFARLVAGGDESSAIVDAVDAVNLMTVHAAKGLEFPVVFVVNLARGSGGGGDPIRVAAAPFGVDDGEASVAIGEYESQADEDADAREAEESKRLLYVALTRARDRLYLGSTVGPDGRFAPWKGSLGRVLPPGFGELFTRAAAQEAEVLFWSGAAGAHRLRVLEATGAVDVVANAADDDRGRVDDFAPLSAPVEGTRVTATPGSREPEVGSPTSDVEAVDAPHSADRRSMLPSSIEAGVLVHRALQRGVLDGADRGRDDLRRCLHTLLRPHERAVVDDLDTMIERAAHACAAIVQRPDLAGVFGAGDGGARPTRLHELPFSLARPDGAIVRGSIDCLVTYPDGRVEVLEFKTGRPLRAHEQQLAVYLEAARALFPGVLVAGRIVYAGEEQLSDESGV